MTEISITEFKSRINEIIESVESSGEEIIITRYGKPVFKVEPFKDRLVKKKSFGELRGKFDSLPDLEYEDFLEVKKIWEPRIEPL